MKVLIVGNRGNFGRALSDFLTSEGHDVSGVDKDERIPTSLNLYDACILTIPLKETMNFLEKTDDSNLIEICSVKTPMKRFSQNVVSIHPMFGPDSINNPKFQNILFINDISPPDALEVIKKLFLGFSVHSLTADQHDKLMSELLVRPYIFSLIGQESIHNPGTEVSCSSYEKLRDLISISAKESERVFRDTIKYNPHSRKILIEIKQLVEQMYDGFFQDTPM